MMMFLSDCGGCDGRGSAHCRNTNIGPPDILPLKSGLGSVGIDIPLAQTVLSSVTLLFSHCLSSIEGCQNDRE